MTICILFPILKTVYNNKQTNIDIYKLTKKDKAFINKFKKFY